MTKLGLIIPCYNEEEVISHAINELHELFKQLIEKEVISRDSFMLFIDDGSQDETWNFILKEKETRMQNFIHGIKFSKNFGHQNALLAGLNYCLNKCDVNVCIDADLQHDIDKIADFISLHKQGNEIILGIKEDRDTDSFLKKYTALFFYKIMDWMGVKIHYNHADFRLMSNRATTEILKFNETNLFLRGIIPMIGLKTGFIRYKVKERFAGKSKYSINKMVTLAWNGITSTTIAPLHFFSFLGGLIFLVSIFQTIYVLMQYCKGSVIPGWASTVLPIYFLGSIQLIGLGVLGEYIGKIYLETKKRPKFIVSDYI